MSDQPNKPETSDPYATSDKPSPPGVSTATSHPDEGVGSMIGPYKLLQLMGKGGMGEVWMAEQTEPVRRRVAVKIIKAGLESYQILARFEAERQALAMMDHPNIAKVLDAGATAAGRPYFVMELVKGIAFTKYCDQEHLTPKERLELFIPVCNAVQHAHQKGIIHRDLKPSNVLIALYDGKPVPKVIDFGIAKATHQKLTERTMFTEVGQIVGTLEYMAPEQAEMNNLDIDTRADIFSLGVMLYELLTGGTPFSAKQLRGETFLEMLRLIREVEPAKPSTKLSKSEELPAIAARRKLEPKKLMGMVQGDLDWIVMKCLEKDRGRRYETANQLGQELGRFLADEPVQAGPPSVGYRTRKFLRRNRGPVIAASLVALALVAGIIGTSFGFVREAQQREIAEANESKAIRAAIEERKAKQQAQDAATAEKLASIKALEASQMEAKATATAQKRLAQIENANGILAAIIQNDLNSAIPHLRKSVEFDPTNPAAHVFLAGLLYKKNDFDSAIKHCNIAIGMDPNFAAVYTTLGAALLQKKDLPGAIANCRKAIQVDPNLAIAHSNLGEALRQSKDLKGAIKHCQIAVELDPSLGMAHSNLGIAFFQTGNVAGAITHLEKAVELQPNFALFHSNLGMVLGETPKLEEAISHCQMAVALDPSLALAHNNLGLNLYRKGDLEGAIKSLRKSIQLDPSFALAHSNLGLALSDRKDFEEAWTHSQKAVELDPDLPHAQNNLGRILLERRDFKNAIMRFQKAIELDPKMASAHFNLGSALYLTKDTKRAITHLRKAIELDPNLDSVHHRLGLALYDDKDLDGAIIHYRKAIEIDPKLALARLDLGDALIGKGQFAEARTVTLELVELLPAKDQFDKWAKQQLELCDRLLSLDHKLSEFIDKEEIPKEHQDQLDLADFCRHRKQYHLIAVRLYSQAFAKRPASADDITKGYRYDAACAAVLAAAGRGLDPQKPGPEERLKLRTQARDWLREDLELSSQKFDAGKAKDVLLLLKWLPHCQSDTDLVSVRDAKSLAGLAKQEQEAWRKFWADADALLKRVHAIVTETTSNGALTEKDRQQIHNVKLEAGKTYIIDMHSTELDSYLKLLDKQGDVMAENDDVESGNLDSRLVFTPEVTGEFRIITTSFKERGRGAYTLKIRVINAAPSK